MVSQDDILAASSQVLIENYGRLPYAMVRGSGAKIWDADGREYLDFFPGFGAGGVGGHCHPKIVEAIHGATGVIIENCKDGIVTRQEQIEIEMAAELVFEQLFDIAEGEKDAATAGH